MRKALITAVSAVVACACSEGGAPVQPSQYSAPLQVQSAQPDGIAKNHRTHLSGGEEVLAVDAGRADTGRARSAAPGPFPDHRRRPVVRLQARSRRTSTTSSWRTSLRTGQDERGVVVWL